MTVQRRTGHVACIDIYMLLDKSNGNQMTVWLKINISDYFFSSISNSCNPILLNIFFLQFLGTSSHVLDVWTLSSHKTPHLKDASKWNIFNSTVSFCHNFRSMHNHNGVSRCKKLSENCPHSFLSFYIRTIWHSCPGDSESSHSSLG